MTTQRSLLVAVAAGEDSIDAVEEAMAGEHVSAIIQSSSARQRAEVRLRDSSQSATAADRVAEAEVLLCLVSETNS